MRVTEEDPKGFSFFCVLRERSSHSVQSTLELLRKMQMKTLERFSVIWYN